MRTTPAALALAGALVGALAGGLSGPALAAESDLCANPPLYAMDDERVLLSIDHADVGPSHGDNRIGNVIIRDAAGEEVAAGVWKLTLMRPKTADRVAIMVGEYTIVNPHGVIFAKLEHGSDFEMHDTSQRPTDVLLTVIAGTDRYAGATGTLDLDITDEKVVFALDLTCR